MRTDVKVTRHPVKIPLSAPCYGPGRMLTAKRGFASPGDAITWQYDHEDKEDNLTPECGAVHHGRVIGKVTDDGRTLIVVLEMFDGQFVSERWVDPQTIIELKTWRTKLMQWWSVDSDTWNKRDINTLRDAFDSCFAGWIPQSPLVDVTDPNTEVLTNDGPD